MLALRHIEQSIVEVNSMALETNRAMEEMYKSSGFMLERVGEVKDVSEITKKGAFELATGVGEISRNLEESKYRIEGINAAISNHKKTNKGILSEVEAIRTSGVWILTDMEGAKGALEKLREDFDLLKTEMLTFKAD